MNKTFAYDPAGDQWREASPMPTARGALAVALVDGRIHAVGGGGAGRRNTGAHEVYDPGSDRWTSAPPLPTPRDHHAAEVIDGRLYAMGGRVDGSYARNLTVNEEYDPRTRQWRTRAPLPNAWSTFDRIFVISGGPRPGGSYSPANEVFRP